MTKESAAGVPRLAFPGRRRTGVLGNVDPAQLAVAVDTLEARLS